MTREEEISLIDDSSLCGRPFPPNFRCGLPERHEGPCGNVHVFAPAQRATFVGAPQQFELNFAVRAVTEAFGYCCYQVGSSLEKRDFRDVDIRCILDDEDFDRMFLGWQHNHLDARISLLNCAISLWLSTRSGLPVDFQFQRMTEANKTNPKGRRNAIGIFIEPKKE